ncbi:MAG: hypothetical protein K8G78_07060 [Deltaproteobacteria bacterium]|nr:hypothetical protein [Candidatus Kapabacteria bacterium]
MTTYEGSHVWKDVYNVPFDGVVLYVKFMRGRPITVSQETRSTVMATVTVDRGDCGSRVAQPREMELVCSTLPPRALGHRGRWLARAVRRRMSA